VGSGYGVFRRRSFRGTALPPEHSIKLLGLRVTLPAETIEWKKTEFGPVFVTKADNAFRGLSSRG